MEKIKSLALEYRFPIGLVSLGLFLIILSSFVLPQNLLEGPRSANEYLIVNVDGQVKEPGLYKVKEGTTIGQILKITGGLTPQADGDYISRSINLAKSLSNGEKIYIPAVGEVNNASQSGAKGALISINSASMKELVDLDGIGQVTAQKIIDNRPYLRTEGLLQRKLVSRSVYTKIKDVISTN